MTTESICAYSGCTNSIDPNVFDRSKNYIHEVEKIIEIERTGELDFPEPHYFENRELCEECCGARIEGKRRALAAARLPMDDHTVEHWRKDLRELDARKDQSPHYKAELDGYQDNVGRMIREPKN